MPPTTISPSQDVSSAHLKVKLRHKVQLLMATITMGAVTVAITAADSSSALTATIHRRRRMDSMRQVTLEATYF
jgi:hypothetical protein